MLEKGKKVGEYVLLEKLGAGGFGDVWRAEKRTALDINHFALKFFRPKEDGVDFDKIGKELAVWKQLKGLPHIISVIELDRFEDYVYVVSDFADGGSLEKWLKTNGGKASSEAEAVQIALEILTGLENLHGKGFVHRDLKPDNILIMNGRYCLADFGISREIRTHSKATGTAGTMEYMPPEAFEKSPSVTPQTDIWAVGVILQRLLTGKLPYPQDDQPSLIAAILMSDADEMPKSVSESLRSIVKKALQKKRENRFQSAGEMREVLLEFLKSSKKIVAIPKAETIELEDSDKNEEKIIFGTKASLPESSQKTEPLIPQTLSETPKLDSTKPSITQPALSESAITQTLPIEPSNTNISGSVSKSEFTGNLYFDEELIEEKTPKTAPVPFVESPSVPKPAFNFLWLAPIFAVGVLTIIGIGSGMYLFNSASPANLNNSTPSQKISTPTATPAPSVSPTSAPTATPTIAPTATPTQERVSNKTSKKNKPTIAPTTDKTPIIQNPVKTPVPKTPKPVKTPDRSDDCVYNGRCRN
jgi:serine/threonine protein kinase